MAGTGRKRRRAGMEDLSLGVFLKGWAPNFHIIAMDYVGFQGAWCTAPIVQRGGGSANPYNSGTVTKSYKTTAYTLWGKTSHTQHKTCQRTFKNRSHPILPS